MTFSRGIEMDNLKRINKLQSQHPFKNLYALSWLETILIYQNRKAESLRVLPANNSKSHVQTDHTCSFLASNITLFNSIHLEGRIRKIQPFDPHDFSFHNTSQNLPV